MLTLKKNVSARMSAPVFAVLLIYFFASWFMLAPPGAAGEAHAGQLEFDGVPVDITTAANEDLVIAPGSGGNSQIGTATGTNTHATTNNDLHVTGALEVDGVSYFDSATYLGDTASDTVTVTGYFGSSLIPSADSTYDLGSSSLAWRYLYADIISGYNANLALNPATGYSLTGAVTKSASSGNEVAYDYAVTINKAAGNYTGIKLNLTQTAAGGPATANFLFDLQLGGVSMFNVDSAGNVTAVGTITGSGAAINGTTSHTFTVNSNNDNALTTLRLGGSGGSNGQVTTVSGNLVIDSNGGTVDINDGILDLSTQTVDVTLNDAVDSLNFDSDTLSIDAQNNRVGIGTGAPDNQLHVSEPTGIVEVAKFEGLNGASIRIDAQLGANTSTTRNYIADTLSAEAGYTPINPGSGYFISVGGNRYLTLDTNGFLGLGDTTPVANLVVGSDAGAAVAGAGDAYIQNDLEVDGTLYAASASIAGTVSDTFTIDTDNTSATPTLTFGNAGNPFITTPAGNLNLQPASAVIIRDATAPAPAKATSAGMLFVENAFENTGIAYHYDDIAMYDKKSFVVISSASGNPDYAHSIYLSQSDNLMQFKEWDTFKFTNTSADPDVDLITLTPTAGMALLNDDVVDNAVSDILKIQHSSTNAPQAGIGTGLAYYVEDAGNLQKHGSIDTVLTTVTQGSENADMVFKISEAGALTELMRLNAASDRVDISGDLNVTGTISGALSATGTTSDTWEVNTDGNSVTIDSAGQTSDHDYTFPNVSGKVLTTNMSDAIVAVTLNDAINALNFDTDTLTIDAANNRVGINTGNPGAQLEVVGTLKVVTGSESTFYAAAVGPYMYIQPKDVAGTDYTRVGGWSSAAAATNLVLQPAGGNIGIGGTFDGNPTTIAPSYLLSLDGQSGRTIGMERHQTAGQAGNDLSIQSGGAYATGSNLNGGNLLLKAGTATGTGASAIIFQTAKAAAAGAADNSPATRALIGGTSLALSPHGTAAGDTLELRFSELAAGGSDYVGFKAPDAIGSNLIWTLPSIDGSDGHVLKTNGLGTLSFGAVGGSTAITGTTNDTFEVNSDGNSVTVSSAGQTSDHVFTFPDATGTVLTTNMPADVAVTLGGGVDALNFDSNTLSIDANSNRVGIGTASPQYSLDVVETARINNSAGAASLILTGAGDAFAYSYVNLLNEAGDKSWNVQHRKAAGFVNDFIIEEYDGAAYYQRFIMRPGGSVGIGTTDFDGTPALGHLIVKGTTNDGSTNIQVWRDSDEANVAYLDTNGNLTLSGSVSASASALTGTTADTFTINSDGTTAASTLALGAAGTTGGQITTGAGNLTIDSTGGTIDINDGVLDLSTQTVDVTLNAAADALNFDSNTLSIDASADRVGIGKANPDHKLDVEGNIRITNSASHANLILSGAGDAFKYSAINLYNEAGDKLWSIHHRKAAVELNNFLIEEYDGADYYQRVSVAPGGNMAIGTVDFDGTPAAGRLIIKGSTPDGSTNILVGRDSDEANVAYLDTDGNLTLSGAISAGSSSLSGTTADTFEVNTDGFGAVLSTTNRSTDGTYTLPNVAGAAQILTTNMSDGDVAVTLYAAGVNGLSFDTDTLSIDAQNHWVGIGTTSPDARLTVDGGGSYSGYVSTRATNDNYCGILFTDADGLQWGLYKNATADPILQFGRYTDGVWQAAPISFARNGDVVFGDRYVGIGDSDPVASLVVGSDAGASVSGVGSAYIQNNLEVDGTLYAAGSSLTGTTADTFTLNSDNTTDIATTLTFGGAGTGTGSITTTVGNLTIAPNGATTSVTGDIDVSGSIEIDSANAINNNGTTSISVGALAGANNAGSNNTFMGASAGTAVNSGSDNTFIGSSAGAAATTAINSTFVGSNAGLSSNAGYNVFIGYYAGQNISGTGNVCVGQVAGYSSNSAASNTFIGSAAGRGNTSGDQNVYIGGNAGYANSTGTGNIFIGYQAGEDLNPVSNILVIDNTDTATPLIYGDFSTDTLTINGTLNATTVGFSGTTADTFTVNSDGTAAASTLALGAAGTTGGQITTGAGNLTIDSTGGTIDINDGVLDLSTQTVDVTLNAAADALNFDSNTLSIDADANRIGIGTPAPSSDLHVVTAATTGNGVFIDGSTVTEGSALSIEVDATAMTTGYPFLITRDTVDMLHVTESGGVVSENIITSDTDSTENLRLGEDQDASIGYDGSDLVINPRVVGTGDMVLSSGNIGIGTAAPDYLLTVAPPGNTEASIGMVSTGGAGAEIYFGYSGAYNAAIGYTQNFEGAIEFKTNGTNNASSKMILTSAGKLGIGTGIVSEPSAALDVQAAVTAASAVANGVRFQQTLTAAADNDSLSGLLINTTYADGGFSGVKHNGIAFPDAQGTKFNLGYDAAKAKWIGIDGSWRQGFANDTGFEFYISSNNTSWGDSKFHIDTDSVDFYVDPVVGTSGTNRWLKMFGNILFEENDDYIGTYNTGTFTVGNLQNTSTATTVNFGRDGGIDVMNFNRGGTTYNFLTLKSAGTDDITLDPAGNDVLPGSDSTDNLGSSGTRWLNGYFDNVYCANQNATNYVTGSDIAENVNSAKPLEPGTVVIIDPDNDSHIVPCKTANDTRVAGIISTKPAVWMGAKENKMGVIEEKEPGKEPLALAGRVPCKVDAGYGPIKRGDLLTTSPTEGHAMVARDPQVGAVVGKAMQSLGSGKGTIEVLVVLR